jgi:hypothetical protein
LQPDQSFAVIISNIHSSFVATDMLSAVKLLGPLYQLRFKEGKGDVRYDGWDNSFFRRYLADVSTAAGLLPVMKRNNLSDPQSMEKVATALQKTMLHWSCILLRGLTEASSGHGTFELTRGWLFQRGSSNSATLLDRGFHGFYFQLIHATLVRFNSEDDFQAQIQHSNFEVYGLKMAETFTLNGVELYGFFVHGGVGSAGLTLFAASMARRDAWVAAINRALFVSCRNRIYLDATRTVAAGAASDAADVAQVDNATVPVIEEWFEVQSFTPIAGWKASSYLKFTNRFARSLVCSLLCMAISP